MSEPRSPARRLALALGSIGAATLAVLLPLVTINKATVVELTLASRRVAFTVVPAASLAEELEAEAGAPAPLGEIRLLDDGLSLRSLLARDLARARVALAGGPLDLGSKGTLRLTGDEPFGLDLTAFGPTRLELETAGRDREGSRRLTLHLAPAAAGGHPPESVPWIGRVESDAGLTAGETADPQPVDPDALPPTLTGGAKSVLGLALAPQPGPATVLRVLDPETGETSPPRRLPFLTTEARSLPWRDRLVLLEPDPGRSSPAALLQPDLRVRDLELFHLVKLDEHSDLLGGTIRFPGGEKAPVTLANRSFLTVGLDAPMTLRSLALTDGRLEMVLWGEAESVRLGPTLDLRAELLPSLFVWLYTHRLAGLAYGALVSVLGASLAIFKTFGLFGR